jgi:Fe-S-cluster containining protein
MEPDTSAPTSTRSGSDLCLPCGLCCDGSLFSHAWLEPAEEGQARSLGLEVYPLDTRVTFRLPCPLFRPDRCSIYGQRRPGICASYQCRQLRNYLRGKVALEDAVRQICVAKARVADLRLQAGSEPNFRERLRQVLVVSPLLAQTLDDFSTVLDGLDLFAQEPDEELAAARLAADEELKYYQALVDCFGAEIYRMSEAQGLSGATSPD